MSLLHKQGLHIVLVQQCQRFRFCIISFQREGIYPSGLLRQFGLSVQGFFWEQTVLSFFVEMSFSIAQRISDQILALRVHDDL